MLWQQKMAQNRSGAAVKHGVSGLEAMPGRWSFQLLPVHPLHLHHIPQVTRMHNQDLGMLPPQSAPSPPLY